MSSAPIITGKIRLKDETARTLSSIQSRISGVFKKISLAAAGLGAAAAAGIGASIKVAADFEQQMIEAGKVIEGFDAHREMLEDLAKTMSEKWAVGTDQVADAMAFMGSMGKDALQIQRELNDVIQMGIALNMDAEQAARLVASAQAIFSKEGLTAAEVADKLNSVTNQTAATTEFLAGALRMAGPAAASTGVTMDQLLGVLTPLAEAGFQGSMAGRALNTILPEIGKHADELTRGLTDLHNQGFDVNIEAMEGFADASPYEQIVKLSKAMKNLTDDQKREVAETIGSTQFFKQMFILLENGEKILEGTGYAINSIGSAQEEAEKTTRSLNFRLAQLKQRILFMGMDIGERLLPSMQGFLDMLDSWMPAIKEAVGKVGDFAKGLFDAAAALAEGDWESAGEILAGIFDGVLESAGDLWNKVKEKLGDWGEKFKELMPKTAEEWDAVWDTFFTWTGTLWTKFKETAGDVATIFKAWLPATSEEWWSVWEGFKSFAEHLWENFGNWMADIEETFFEWVSEVDWDYVFSGLKAWAEDFGDWLWEKIWGSVTAGPGGWKPPGYKEGPYRGPGIFGRGGWQPPGAGKGLFNIWEWLKGVLGFAEGGAGVVTRPTLFLAGEAGPEAFSFTPLGAGRARPSAPVIRIGAIYIQAGDLGSEYGRSLAARDLVEKIGKEWILQR